MPGRRLKPTPRVWEGWRRGPNRGRPRPLRSTPCFLSNTRVFDGVCNLRQRDHSWPPLLGPRARRTPRAGRRSPGGPETRPNRMRSGGLSLRRLRRSFRPRPPLRVSTDRAEGRHSLGSPWSPPRLPPADGTSVDVPDAASMPDDNPEAGSASTARRRAPVEDSKDPLRTMAGLLGRAWLERDRPSSVSVARSGAQSMSNLGFAAAASGFGMVPRPLSISSRAPTPRPEAGTPAGSVRTPVGGVASFVVDVATSQPPLDPDARRGRFRASGARAHRGIHCRLGGSLGTASHNPCQRPPTAA